MKGGGGEGGRRGGGGVGGVVFFFNDTATTEIYTLSLHDALPISGIKTLIVEDDFACRKALQIFLSEYGNCFIAVNGCEAVEAVRQALDEDQPYDLICLDIMMPEMDGHERSEEHTSELQSH